MFNISDNARGWGDMANADGRRTKIGHDAAFGSAGPAPGFKLGRYAGGWQPESVVDIERFMQGYKAAWEGQDETLFCALFAADATYHNTPFAVQRGHAELAAYWQRVKLQRDIHLRYEVLATQAGGGIAHWHVSYQVASEELFRIWAQSTGTHLVARQPGDPLPRMLLDGVLVATFAGGLCRECRIWWHSLPEPA